MQKYPTIRKTASLPQLSDGLGTSRGTLVGSAADFCEVLIFYPVPGPLAPVLPDKWVVVRNEMRLLQSAANLRPKPLGIRVKTVELDLDVLASRNKSRLQHPAQQFILPTFDVD